MRPRRDRRGVSSMAEPSRGDSGLLRAGSPAQSTPTLTTSWPHSAINAACTAPNHPQLMTEMRTTVASLSGPHQLLEN